ncbi:MAG: phage holin family protein [Chlorobiaceae bacterium]|nr:phage holin family protein [Chlorobiaceae bacterium]
MSRNKQEIASSNSRKERPEKSRTGIPGLIDDTVSSTYEDLMAIIEAKLELLRIELTDKVALVSALVILAVILMIGTAYLITSIALMIGELLGHAWLGYLAVSMIFLICFVVFTKVRPEMLKNFIHKILLSANDYRK